MEFIETVKGSLLKAIELRQSYPNERFRRLFEADHDAIRNRMFQIYTTDIPNIGIEILYKLGLTGANKNYGQHDVNSLFETFSADGAKQMVTSGFHQYFNMRTALKSVDQLYALTTEMQSCLDKLQLIA